MATEKRARKKEARDAALAARDTERRRRRNARLGGLGLVLALIVGLALFTGNDEGTTPRSQPGDEEEAAEGTAEPGSDDGAIACNGEDPPEADPQQYDSPPDLELDEGVDYRAIVETSCGTIEMDLLEEKAPKSVANFVFLAQEGYYDGLIWHRVEQNAVIQTGDPDGQNGTPPDDPGYSIEDEFPEQSTEYVYGVIGMANRGPGTTGSQWFVVVHDPPPGSCDAEGAPIEADELETLDDDERFSCPAGYQPLYSIFAEVDPGSYETLETIAALETQGGNDPVEAVKPVETVYIESIEIAEK
ncbi:MAG: peptidylprolyl isomerase [Actinomycetota bacterium]